MKETIAALIEQFAVSARKHSAATLEGDYRTCNREAGRLHETYLSIKAMGAEAREALLALAQECELGVAGLAAAYSLSYDSERALWVLRRMAKHPGILGFGSQQAILRWKEGQWKLDD